MRFHNKAIFLISKNRHTDIYYAALYSHGILFAIHRMYFYMEIVKSRIVRKLKKSGCFLLVALLTGCSLPPVIPIIGAYYPDWFFCIIVGVLLTLITRRGILRKYKSPSFAGIIYTALFALYSMLFWLVFF